MFRDRVEQFKSGDSYNVSHMVLKKFNFRYFLQTSKETVVTPIPSLNIESEASTLLKTSKVGLKVAEFTQVRKIDVFKPCPSCSAKFELVKENERFVWCRCNSKIKRTRFALVKSRFQAEVEFLLKEDQYIWATIFSSAFELKEDLPSKESVEEYLSDLENIHVTVDVEKNHHSSK